MIELILFFCFDLLYNEIGDRMLIGSHVSFSTEQILGSAKEAVSYGANTFMFYTGAPQNTIRKEINPELVQEAREYMKEHGIDINTVICHAPYIVNLANRKDEDKWLFSIDFLKKELQRCDSMGVKYMVLHPGSSVGQDHEVALKNILDGLLKIVSEKHNCKILLETMALKGTEIGSLEDIQFLLEATSYQVGVCLDTCHLHDSGLDLSNVDQFLEYVDKTIGLENIYCVHLNDSKNEVGAKKDRHANIGHGCIGFATLNKIAHHEKLKSVPKILETPYVGETWEDKNRLYPPYKQEIEMLQNQVYDEDLLEHILETR